MSIVSICLPLAIIHFFLYFSCSSQGPRVDNRRRKQQWQVRVARQDCCGPVSSGHPGKLPGKICHVLVAALNLKLLKNCIEKNRLAVRALKIEFVTKLKNTKNYRTRLRREGE